MNMGSALLTSRCSSRQSKEYGVTLKDELRRLIIHGVPHLCGYDHEKVPAKEAQRMRRRERAIARALAEK
jgi:probable rRNA maturation factor